jgi:hypothetical protein
MGHVRPGSEVTYNPVFQEVRLQGATKSGAKESRFGIGTPTGQQEHVV